MEQLRNIEQQQQEPPSPLYPERSASEATRAVVRRPEFQDAIYYRLSQALYKNRTTAEVVFPKLRLPGALPTFDAYINTEVFAEEEAIAVDRIAREYLTDNPSDEEMQAQINALSS